MDEHQKQLRSPRFAHFILRFVGAILFSLGASPIITVMISGDYQAIIPDLRRLEDVGFFSFFAGMLLMGTLFWALSLLTARQKSARLYIRLAASLTALFITTIVLLIAADDSRSRPKNTFQIYLYSFLAVAALIHIAAKKRGTEFFQKFLMTIRQSELRTLRRDLIIALVLLFAFPALMILLATTAESIA